MPSASRVCPFCGKLNARTDERCAYCERRMPAPPDQAARQPFAGAGQYWATLLFVGLSVAIYLLLALGSGNLLQGIRGGQALRWGALVGELGWHEPWRFLSAMFVHFGLLHIGFNTLTLHSLGKNLESSLGWGRFTLIFLGTGIAGFIASQLWYTQQPLTGGISGGIFGLLGAAVGWRFAQGDREWRRLGITALGYAVVMILIPGLGINHAAHLGGLAAGAALGWALFRLGGERRPSRALNRVAALLIVATFASIALSLTSPAGQLRATPFAGRR